jgi:macrolide transport system ATP-binding/permease protein
MTSLFRRFKWWLRREHKENELREELQFHLDEEAEERRAGGLPRDQARTVAHRDIGNVTRLREETRALWTWTLLEQLIQDLRYGLRMLVENRAFTVVVALSLALGIGANTVIYSFMDAVLLRSLPVPDPGSLVAIKWRSKPFAYGSRATQGSEFVLHGIEGDYFDDPEGQTGAILPFVAFERLQQVSEPVLSSIFAFFRGGKVNAFAAGSAELANAEYVSGDFFRGLAVPPAAGRLLFADDDRAGAPNVAVISTRFSERRFGGAANAAGQPIVINNVPFTVVGVTPPGFFGVDPGEVPDVYLPLHAMLLLVSDASRLLIDPNYYWVEIMGRLRPEISLAQAESLLAGPFGQWVATTATNDRERANLPQLRVERGAAGRDILRRQYAKPLYVLLAMVGLILAIACANTANLLLARATARSREIAMRLSLGASRSRIVRQLLTESVLLASLGGALGILIAQAGIRLLTVLLANGDEAFTLHAELNWNVLTVTLTLSVLCGVLFGLAPAIQSSRRVLMPALKNAGLGESRSRLRDTLPRLSLAKGLVVAQIALSLLLLFGAGLFVRTLGNLHRVHFGFNRDHLLLFEVNAPQAGHAGAEGVAFYAALRQRLSEIPGVNDATLSHASLVRAGRAYSITVDGTPSRGHRILSIGPRFFSTMQIALLRGRGIEERDRAAAVVSDDFAKRTVTATRWDGTSASAVRAASRRSIWKSSASPPPFVTAA